MAPDINRTVAEFMVEINILSYPQYLEQLVLTFERHCVYICIVLMSIKGFAVSRGGGGSKKVASVIFLCEIR